MEQDYRAPYKPQCGLMTSAQGDTPDANSTEGRGDFGAQHGMGKEGFTRKTGKG